MWKHNSTNEDLNNAIGLKFKFFKIKTNMRKRNSINDDFTNSNFKVSFCLWIIVLVKKLYKYKEFTHKQKGTMKFELVLSTRYKINYFHHNFKFITPHTNSVDLSQD